MELYIKYSQEDIKTMNHILSDISKYIAKGQRFPFRSTIPYIHIPVIISMYVSDGYSGIILSILFSIMFHFIIALNFYNKFNNRNIKISINRYEELVAFNSTISLKLCDNTLIYYTSSPNSKNSFETIYKITSIKKTFICEKWLGILFLDNRLILIPDLAFKNKEEKLDFLNLIS